MNAEYSQVLKCLFTIMRYYSNMYFHNIINIINTADCEYILWTKFRAKYYLQFRTPTLSIVYWYLYYQIATLIQSILLSLPLSKLCPKKPSRCLGSLGCKLQPLTIQPLSALSHNIVYQNMAKGGTASQDSTSSGGVASRAIDGNKNTIYKWVTRFLQVLANTSLSKNADQ